jgi:hypothetical protein
MKHTLLLCLWALSSPLLAQEAKPAEYATREQLADCLDKEEAVKTSQKQLSGSMAGNKAETAALTAETAALIERQAKVDLKDEKAVAASNAEQDALNLKIAAFNKKADAYNAEREKHNALSTAHNQQCSGKLYKVSDKEAVLKARAEKKS